MTRGGGYRIVDEPRPGPLSHLATNPIWPLFATLLAGGWLGLPWFVFNGQVIGSASRWKELAIAAAYLVGTPGLVIGLLVVWRTTDGSESALPYLFMLVTVFQLGFAYWLFFLQATSFQIYEYFGGTARNGLLVVLVGAFWLRSRVMAAAGTGLLAWMLS